MRLSRLIERYIIIIIVVVIFQSNTTRQLKLAADLNNMSWKVRPEEVLIEVSKPYSSRLALQKPTEVIRLCTFNIIEMPTYVYHMNAYETKHKRFLVSTNIKCNLINIKNITRR